jgi:hypothetical protein
MKKIIEYFMSIRHNHPKVIEVTLEMYLEDLIIEFPNDADLGKYIRNQ